jgi:hypothetical protein
MLIFFLLSLELSLKAGNLNKIRIYPSIFANKKLYQTTVARGNESFQTG